jgi:hypothetical protein
LDPSKPYVCILHKTQDGTEYNKPNGNPYQSHISYEEKYKEQSMKSTTNYADSSPPPNHRFGRGTSRRKVKKHTNYLSVHEDCQICSGCMNKKNDKTPGKSLFQGWFYA